VIAAEPVRRISGLLGIDRLLDTYPSVEAARARPDMNTGNGIRVSSQPLLATRIRATSEHEFELVGEPGPRALSDPPDYQFGDLYRTGASWAHASACGRGEAAMAGHIVVDVGSLSPEPLRSAGAVHSRTHRTQVFSPPKSWVPLRERTAPAVS
jgi:hypothetical protein